MNSEDSFTLLKEKKAVMSSIYIYIYIYRERERDRQTDRQRQRDRQIEGLRDKVTER